tara:strand:+ start:18265 stop:18474 length:210 start_codon:yes stop_codon:yes gene_type:complete
MKPITLEEYTEAGDDFMPKYRYVASLLPPETKPEQVLKVMESLAAVAMKKRVEDKLAPFGFNKKTEEDE